MSVFVDTSALYAALAADDVAHDLAVVLLESVAETDELVTHNYIHVEAEALVRRRLGANAAATLAERVLPALRTIWVDEAIHAAGLEAVRSAGRPTTFVDEVSFLVMRSAGVRRALAFDRDFERAGFSLVQLPARRSDRRLSEPPAAYGSGQSADGQLVGVAEIAIRSGRSVNTVQSWRRRDASFPAPAATLAAGPVWRWDAVAGWLADRRQEPSRRTTGPVAR